MNIAQTSDQTAEDKRAPMASAPMKYKEDGEVDWGNMWDTFCVLAVEGGPRHRDTMLLAQEDGDPTNPIYIAAVTEIVRGVKEVIDFEAWAADTGWIAIQGENSAHTRWLVDAIKEENVQARADGSLFFVPVGDYFTLKGEIKNVITAVAKTTHYWRDHLPIDVKRTLQLQAQMDEVKAKVGRWFKR